jgi:two-component system, NtrC family, nitrogen regulation response regulator NtrX
MSGGWPQVESKAINIKEKLMREFTILIVDDDEGIRDSLSGIFEDEGYKVLTASSCEETMIVLKVRIPDLILLDSWLSDINGIQTLKDIKGKNPDIPVIMMLEHRDMEVAVKAIHMGAYDLLEKPFSLEKVLLCIKRALKENN